MPTLGLFGLNQTADSREGLARLGPLAEELGYDSIWMGEHVVVPDPHVPPSPMQPEDPILDGLVALSYAAAATERIGLATGIVILPQRNPVVLAKQLASLDVLSGGRLRFGIGVGYLEPEMTAVGVPMERRGARADEYLAAMRSLWEDEQPSFDGEFVSFSGVSAEPRPLQRPLPVVVGGHSAAAHRRAARGGQGWYGFFLDRDQTEQNLEGLRKALAEEGRDLDDLEITVTARGIPDAEMVEAFGAIGVDRLVLMLPGNAPTDDLDAFMREHAPERLGADPL